MDTPNTYWDLFWGYLIIWALVFVMIARIGLQQRRMQAELERIGR